MPAESIEVSLWLDTYREELVVLEAVPNGSPVNAGDVLIRLDLKKIDEQIKQAEFALTQQEERTRLGEEDMRILDETGVAELERAQRDADWSRRRLKGFLEQEKEHKREGERLRDQAEQSQIEDQTDELTQLEKMYKEDELVDATEEIVLKRSRRGLAQLRASIALQRQVRQYARDLADVIQQETLETDMAQKLAALERQKRGTEGKRAGRKLDIEKARLELERQKTALERVKKDRDMMVVRAPKRGIVLHGDPRSVPGSLKIERGSVLPPRKCVMTVAEPGKFGVLTDLKEDDVFRIKPGTAVEVLPAGLPDVKLVGSIRVANMATAREGTGDNLYEAAVELQKTDPRLRFGMRCKVLIRADEATR